MKKYRKQFIFCYLIIFSLVAYSQEKTIWEYPIKPGDEEWKNFKNHKEKVDACQVPESILYSINTNDLTDLCLRYPLLYSASGYSNFNNGLKNLITNFNGIRELSKRKDATTHLREKYL